MKYHAKFTVKGSIRKGHPLLLGSKLIAVIDNFESGVTEDVFYDGKRLGGCFSFREDGDETPTLVLGKKIQ